MLPLELQEKLKSKSSSWLVTGAAGFIGSHLVQALLEHNQKVVGLDNLFSGKQSNLDQVRQHVGDRFSDFTFIQASIEDPAVCEKCCEGVDYVLHQAALGSVSRSIENPKIYDSVNVGGFLNMLLAARNNKVKKFVYASSSSVYGDEPNLPKREERIGKPLSPYAISKLFNEKYAELFASLYGVKSVGLRYFNVFGPRQDPLGQYAAVIPRWISERMAGKQCSIFGDGTTSRDFCYVSNVVQANLLSALNDNLDNFEVFNVALGDETSLNELYNFIDSAVSRMRSSTIQPPAYHDFRVGDVKHSKADISNIQKKLGFKPDVKVEQGLNLLLQWFKENSDA